MNKYAAVHEVGHFLMFLKESVRLSDNNIDGCYWTYGAFMHLLDELTIFSDDNTAGKFSYYRPGHKKFNLTLVILGGIAIEFAYYNKHKHFGWFEYFCARYDTARSDILKCRKQGLSRKDIINTINEIIDNISNSDKHFIEKMKDELYIYGSIKNNKLEEFGKYYKSNCI